jgi:hypothetical protein
MRKSGTHSARALGKKSARKRGGRKRDARVSLLAFCALAAGIVAATYGLTHQSISDASTSTQAAGIAAPKNGTDITGTAIADPKINEQAARKEDRLVTGSVPKQEEIAPPKADAKATPHVAKKKKNSVATAKTEAKSFFDVFKPDAKQQKR